MIEQVFTKEQHGWEWVDVTAPTKQELEQVAEKYGLHPTSLEDCLDSRHQPKFELLDDMQFIILRGIENVQVSTDDVSEMTTKVAIFTADAFLLTVHRKAPSFLNDLKTRCSSRASDCTHGMGKVDFLYALLREIMESYRPVTDKLEAELDNLEKDMILQEQTPALIKEIHWFRSRVSLIRRLFRQSYEVILKIEDVNPDSPLIHDVRERVERFLHLTESLRESSNDILNTHLSLAAHRTNEVIRILTLFSVFFLPLTFIVGVYGMNFEYMPELKWRLGYLWSWGVMALVTIGIYLLFRKRKWL